MANDLMLSQMTVGALPPAQKSQIRRWYESLQADTATAAIERAKLHGRAAIDGLRAGGESLMVGGILGAAQAALPDGLDYQKKYPVDAGVGAVAILGSALLAHEPFAGDIRNAGAACLAVFGFRKSFAVIAEMRKREGKPVPEFAGDDDDDIGAEDPIIAAARHL